MNEINMVPFIDVMLVLLIIFMVTAPMLTPGMIDVPTVGKASKQPPAVAQVLVTPSGQLQLKTSDFTRTFNVKEIGAAAKAWQMNQMEGSAVVISAEKNVPYESVVKALDSLQRAGVIKVGLSVKQGG